ncbi:hypothetical protein [Zobellia galactanivorans]|uniref:Uncharacterized protein n=1 Tax=Zobellia galactanivorans (strain DSM 12802 / CCUG 47099 / CIP 106680 / NCIMB 13871 / Dsij) TaxID=63186 RepID=G0L060_ZOBGA|nr:hypothetical protein [Zobellia galactanivorans]CAZ97387.1 Conserved hypothetical protein [Zobellia galactanivorans]
MKTLKLFNSVKLKETNEKPFVSEQGYIIESGALWAKEEIIRFYENEKLDGFGLNKTFHKSWNQIFKSTRTELLFEQIKHYISTYGSNFQDEIYIPNEVLESPDLKVKFKVIKGCPQEELIEKCLSLLQSGIALKEETINDIISVLVDELSYQFTGNENIKNKEATIKIADTYSIVPTDILEFFRYILYRTTGESLLIKSDEVIEAIKKSNYNPAVQFEQFGLERLAEIFNRFKPLFLAFKTKCPKTINKISKLSKIHHKPLVGNPLNNATSIILLDKDKHWLDNATPFALFRALSACHTRLQGQFAFTYRIRNGKSFVKTNKVSRVVRSNYDFLMQYCEKRFDLNGKKFFLPHNVEFSLPTSEKMFVGNIPTGSKIFGKSLAVGIYWENDWGAHDLDLSGLNIGGKIGWNSDYKQGEGSLMYSGDITNAPNGAVEYLYAQNGLSEPTLVKNNVYTGEENCEYKIIVGKGDKIDYNYMMDPNNLFLETKCQSVQRQTILGMLIPEKERQCFVVLNIGAGASRVSGNSEISLLATKALFQQWSNPILFRDLILALGAEIVEKIEDADYNFSLDNLQKDSFIKLFQH